MSNPFLILCLTPESPSFMESWKHPDLGFLHCPTATQFKILLASQKPDLILSDFSLPGLALKEVQALLAAEQLDIPLIAIPKQATEKTVAQFMSEGTVDCVPESETEHLKLVIDRELKNLRIQRELREKRRAAVRLVSSRLAHDFNNILAPVSMSAPMLKWDLEDAEYDDILDTLEQTTQIGATTIQQLQVFGRGTDLDRHDVSAAKLLHETVTDFRKTLPENITLEIEPVDNGLSIFVDQEKFNRSLFSILENAREAMPAGGIIKIKAEAKSGSSEFLLTISDRGEGMDDTTLEQIFDPFFSTKRNARKGAGLGLSLALGIVKSHGGDITAESRSGKGSIFWIILPARKK